MTLLPIVDRELRRAARRPGTYWSRLLVALAAVGISTIIFAANLGLSPQQVGQTLFRGLAGLLLLFCLVQGRRGAADSLSEEKREGTLGLLFLTDLKGQDVVLGKLAATSLSGFYGLMAVFPILALTLLLGGITSGEFWRMVLVLLNTFLFSLAVGSLTSALSREHRRAMAANFLLLLLLSALPPACASLIAYFSPSQRFIPELFYSCPVFTFYYAFAWPYASNPQAFWCSLGTTHALSWLLVGLASRAVTHTWQDAPSVASTNPWRRFWRTVSYGKASQHAPFRRRLLGVNAFYWLASRARLKPVHVWTFLALLGVWWLVGWLTSGSLWLDPATAVILALLANTTLKIWLAIEAGACLAEDQHAGALELLLSTPFGVREIVRGQWLALRRQFLKPFLLTLIVEFLLTLWVAQRFAGFWVPAIWLTGMFMLVLDALALGWVAMRQALTAKNHNLATIRTLARVLVSPCLAGGLILVTVQAWSFLSTGAPWQPTWFGWLGLWFWPGLAADWFFGWVARRQLYARFREYALQRYAPPAPTRFSFGSPRRAPSLPTPDATLRPAPPRRVPSWKSKKAAVVYAALLLLGLGGAWFARSSRTTFPPPLVVSLTQSNTPLQMCRAQSLFLLLPDGSLWRWSMPAGKDPAQTSAPEPIGADKDWREISAGGMACLGRRSDGSLWEWGWPVSSDGQPRRLALPARDWVGLGGFSEYYALARDGSLWTWNTANAPRSPGPVTVSEFDTNRNWAALKSLSGSMLALRTDGTLWAWGFLRATGNAQGWSTRALVPIRVCADTNWSALTPCFGTGLVWTRSGELWDPFQLPPNPDAPVAAMGRLILTNSAPERVAFGYVGGAEIYQVRPNGTLWRKPYPLWWAASANDDWSQIGQRADWLWLCSAGGTVIGLTRDGTLWTWGIDFSHPGTPGFAQQLALMRYNLGALFAGRSRGFGGSPGSMPSMVKEPRPLMKLLPPPVAAPAKAPPPKRPG